MNWLEPQFSEYGIFLNFQSLHGRKGWLELGGKRQTIWYNRIPVARLKRGFFICPSLLPVEILLWNKSQAYISFGCPTKNAVLQLSYISRRNTKLKAQSIQMGNVSQTNLFVLWLARQASCGRFSGNSISSSGGLSGRGYIRGIAIRLINVINTHITLKGGIQKLNM